VFKEGEALEQIPISRSHKTTLGRTDCTITLDHPSLSRKHAMICFQDLGFTIIDLASTHGTKVDGKRLQQHQPVEIRSGSMLEFGASTRNYVLRVPAAIATQIDKAKAAEEAVAESKAKATEEADAQPMSKAEEKRHEAMAEIEQRQARMHAELLEIKAKEKIKLEDDVKKEQKAKVRREAKKRKWKEMKHDKRRHKPEKVKVMTENERVAAAAGGSGMNNYNINI